MSIPSRRVVVGENDAQKLSPDSPTSLYSARSAQSACLAHSGARSSHFRRARSVKSPHRRKGVYGATQTSQFSSSDELIDSGASQSLRRPRSRVSFACERTEDDIRADISHSLELDQHTGHERSGSKMSTNLQFNDRTTKKLTAHEHSENFASTDANLTCAMRSFLEDSGNDSGQEICHRGGGESIADGRVAQNNTAFTVGRECAALDESPIGMPVALSTLYYSGSLGDESKSWNRDTTSGDCTSWTQNDIEVRPRPMVWYRAPMAV